MDAVVPMFLLIMIMRSTCIPVRVQSVISAEDESRTLVKKSNRERERERLMETHTCWQVYHSVVKASERQIRNSYEGTRQTHLFDTRAHRCYSLQSLLYSAGVTAVLAVCAHCSRKHATITRLDWEKDLVCNAKSVDVCVCVSRAFVAEDEWKEP